MDRRKFLRTACLSLGSFLLLGAHSSKKDEDILKSIFHREYRATDSLARRDNQYILDNMGLKSVDALINHERTRSKLFNQLQRLKHIDYEKMRNGFFNFPDTWHRGNLDIYRLNMRQLARVYLILESLKNIDFKKSIGDEIALDKQDSQVKEGFLPTERGGLITLKDGLAQLLPIESLDSKKPYSEVEARTSNGLYYIDPIKVNQNPAITRYHFHAVMEDNSDRSGPSYNVRRIKGGIAGDLNCSRERTSNVGESHDLVISSLKDEKFNVCYYSGEIDKGGKPNIIILSLGNWSYS